MSRLTTAMLAAAAFVAAPLLAQPVPDDGTGDGREQVRGDEITPESRDAVERGLEWLASQQRPDGGFGDVSGGTAYTSVAAIAMMSAGHLPNRGKYGQNVAQAVDYVLSKAEPSGLLCPETTQAAMYHHGFAALLLGEVYGMTGDDRIKEPLRRAVQLIEQSQNSEGGWRYDPVPIQADISVTICQVMALRAARDSGIKVEKQVIDNAVEYVRKCQNSDGGFNYMLGRGNNSGFARSAAGVATLYYAGISEGDEIDNGLEYILRHVPDGPVGGRAPHYYYGQYYAAQATFLAGGEAWATWFPAIREQLVSSQQADGRWNGDQDRGVDTYSTAMALIVLQMPNRYLPVFSGKGPGA